ncbi:AAA family ATPase [Acidiferrimicrobium sp. IK]|uniref:AAA family ATPase n=1 Tax=Acidiferrimicrobium sp. IK TaxID=2871700 RepID=UPI0021CB195C|nr:AAA family ATPase [Acidiferrimicrobium sp. IK]MCU4183847.1 AAA family ATPase [Acidiferrimicrobium sp. IK]
MTALKPTPEQQAILDASGTGGTVAISAAAGSGKTSTLRMVAATRPKTRMLYLAFNKAIQREAESSFPSNVTAKTAHALAYAEFGKPMRDRLNGPRMTGRDNARVLGITRPLGLDADRFFKEPTLASMALGMVARFCRSDSPDITVGHFRAPEGLSEAEGRHIAGYLLPYAARAWQDLTAGPRGKLKPSHDVYLKQWALSGPALTGWDVILYDFSSRPPSVVVVGLVLPEGVWRTSGRGVSPTPTGPTVANGAALSLGDVEPRDSGSGQVRSAVSGPPMVVRWWLR